MATSLCHSSFMEHHLWASFSSSRRWNDSGWGEHYLIKHFSPGLIHCKITWTPHWVSCWGLIPFPPSLYLLPSFIVPHGSQHFLIDFKIHQLIFIALFLHGMYIPETQGLSLLWLLSGTLSWVNEWAVSPPISPVTVLWSPQDSPLPALVKMHMQQQQPNSVCSGKLSLPY